MKLAHALSALLLVACTADAGEPIPTGEAIETDEAAATAAKYYDCNRTFSDDFSMQHLEVGFTATKVTVTDLSKGAMAPDSGRIDPTYEPTSPDYVARYVGFPVLESDFNDDVHSVQLMVSPAIKQRAPQGKLWIRMAGGGGSSFPYNCKSKPAKLKIVTSLKTRLACNLDQLLCTNDNPPGETCLVDFFVNQNTADGATLKLNYFDHVNVLIERRSMNVGASTDLSRTTRKVDAKWGAHDLKLTHRAGITYTGTLALPDGRSQSVQCNDLAMLD